MSALGYVYSDYDFKAARSLTHNWAFNFHSGIHDSAHDSTGLKSTPFGSEVEWNLSILSIGTTPAVFLAPCEHKYLFTVRVVAKWTGCTVRKVCETTTIGTVHYGAPIALVIPDNIRGKFDQYRVDFELTWKVVSMPGELDLFDILTDEKYTDCELVAEGLVETPFRAHRAILATRSTVFAAMFYGSTCQEKVNGIVIIDDISFAALACFLKYLYVGFCNAGVLDKFCVDLFKAAHKYDVSCLRDVCVTYFKRTITVNNAVSILKLADTYSDADLIKCATTKVVANLPSCERTEDWKELEKAAPDMAYSIVKKRAAATTLCLSCTCAIKDDDAVRKAKGARLSLY